MIRREVALFYFSEVAEILSIWQSNMNWWSKWLRDILFLLFVSWDEICWPWDMTSNLDSGMRNKYNNSLFKEEVGAWTQICMHVAYNLCCARQSPLHLISNMDAASLNYRQSLIRMVNVDNGHCWNWSFQCAYFHNCDWWIKVSKQWLKLSIRL